MRNIQSAYMINVVNIPLSNQLQVVFLEARRIFEVREGPTQMYHWTSLLTSQLLVEYPWNVVGSFLLFVTWYWTVGLQNDSAAYTFLMVAIVIPLFYTTFSLAIAALSPNATTSALLFGLLFSVLSLL